MRRIPSKGLFPETEAAIRPEMAVPPTEEEWQLMQNVTAESLEPRVVRPSEHRVFVNRRLNYEKISWLGFDMDFTIAVYKSPDYESLIYEEAVSRLLDMGYPEQIRQLHFDATFPVRGLFLDSKLGNLLKVDRFGSILNVVHGRRSLRRGEIRETYGTTVVQLENLGRRFYLLDTLFQVPEACLYADLVRLFEDPSNVGMSPLFDGNAANLSFHSLFQDVRTAIEHVHGAGDLKSKTVADIERFVVRDPRAPLLFDQLRRAGKKLFLLTNSDYKYSDRIMSYLFDEQLAEYPSWRDYFDVIITSGRKPLFFEEGTPLRMIDLSSGAPRLGAVERFERGVVYRGGSLALFSRLTGAEPHRVLYIGDHIFSDIIASKRTLGWRTLLVVRELEHELTVFRLPAFQETYRRLMVLEFQRAELSRRLDCRASEAPDTSALQRAIRDATHELDRHYNTFFGSVFRTAAQRTFFAFQVERYADLYAADYAHLFYYPPWYLFSPATSSLPHEQFGASSRTRPANSS